MAEVHCVAWQEMLIYEQAPYNYHNLQLKKGQISDQEFLYLT